MVGLDTDVTYEKFVVATLAIQKGATFIGTNPDKNIPTERGLLPGAGFRWLPWSKPPRKQKAIYIGKPEAIIMEKAVETLGMEKANVLMVGDNYTTDILAGINNGIDTSWYCRAFTQKADVPTLPVPPTYLVDSLDEVAFQWRTKWLETHWIDLPASDFCWHWRLRWRLMPAGSISLISDS